MNVIVAKSAGFCYGVSRAVELCKKTADEHKKCLTLGPIIHNEHVINDLEKIGVHAVNDVSEVSEGSIVVIRSHGAGKSDYEALEALSCNIIYATCPDVKKIHDIVRNESNNGRLIFIIGEKDHPEVSAIAGWCKNYEIFQSNTELSECLNTSNYTDIPTSVVFQTTSTNDEYNLCCNIIKKECTNIKIFDTICNATCRRQQEAV
ncbi:MAG: bifunctional 4-hydroxy-3-methylbut-2-enyl diphosphate reductase/30S ribosomal protein S1, partial [Oscillospiraceae bacterium]|nr:bifunctional 4-hydroxy-3-methylbut-2-enyl diphosphate reductase/30S ribosomal protein S1 [Oscillospiraceae bacterium]